MIKIFINTHLTVIYSKVCNDLPKIQSSIHKKNCLPKKFSKIFYSRKKSLDRSLTTLFEFFNFQKHYLIS